jgi:hypothetical protein
VSVGGKRKLVERLMLLLPVAFLMIGVNHAVDPAGLFHDNSGAMAEQWSREGRVEIRGNVDDRRLQEEMIRRAPLTTDGLILGSSRSMQIRASSFPEYTILNCSVAGASIEDDIALYELALERGLMPKMILLTLDPWLLNRSNGQDRWKSIGKAYDRGLRRLALRDESREGVIWDEVEKWRQLASPGYFQESLKTVWRSQRGPNSGGFTRRLLTDGSTEYPSEFSDPSPEHVRQLAELCIKGREVYAIDGFSAIDERASRLLEGFVKHLRSRGSQVRFFLAPYHPRVHSFVASTGKYRQVGASEARFGGLAAREGIPVIGSYDPGACGFTEKDFLDGMHAREAAVARLIALSK